MLRHKILSAFDIRRPETRVFLKAWLSSPSPLTRGQFEDEEQEASSPEGALAHFRMGVALKRQGRMVEALAEWRKAVALDPDNYLHRKQVWAAQHPDKFYDGDVDDDWQDQQIKFGH